MFLLNLRYLSQIQLLVKFVKRALMEPCKLLWRRHWWQAREMFSEILDCRRLPTLRTDFVPTSPLELCTSIRGVLRKRGVFKLMNSIVNAANPFCVSRSLSAFTLYRWFFFPYLRYIYWAERSVSSGNYLSIKREALWNFFGGTN